MEPSLGAAHKHYRPGKSEMTGSARCGDSDWGSTYLCVLFVSSW
jgi:hypothetical protein